MAVRPLKAALARSGGIETLTTTELENAARDYGRGMGNPRLSEFERTAILKGITLELALRGAERRELHA
jgi:hypothetical protein